MDVKQTLQKNFPEVKDAFFEKEAGALFLRIEVSLKTLDQVSELSRNISNFLDQNEPSEKEYFLDIYSSGAEHLIELDDLENYFEKTITVKLKKPIKDKPDFEGKLLSVDQEKIIIRWNAKGQFRKQEIEKSNIESVKLTATF